ncbi:MAG TPA: ABC transporter permease [Vicinamibacterales bacterium]|nr:ABC transporter permease [Vicinamibacterales bacterium]
MFDSWLQDLRYAVRLLRRNPLFALTAVLSLAIGIGANTTIFTIANALLFKPPLGVADASRLVDVGRSQDGQGFDNGSYANYLDIRARNTVFSGIYAYRLGPEPMSLRGKDGAERIYGEMVSTNYFNVLGTPPHIGRLFTSDDSEQPAATPLAVLSHRFWMRRFNGDPAIVGQTLVLNGRPFMVIGVTPEGFHGTTVLTSDLWVPVNMVGELAPRLPPAILTSRESAWLVMGARLKPGVTVGQAQAELANIGRALEQEFPDANRGKGLRVVASSPVPGDGAPVAAFMAVLMAIVMLVLAIACANVAGVLLARATTRRREIAVRLAIGAGRGRLIRQMLVESTLLFLIGGSGGLVLARLMTGALLSLLPAVPLPIDVTLALDGRAVVFTLTLSLVAAILSGLAPAFHASRAEVVGALKSDTQGGPERIWLRHAFVVSQVALSIVLVVGAGLFARALQRASEIDPGFDPHGVELATLDLSLGGYTADTGRVFARELIRRVRETPGVQAAALSAVMPLGDRGIGLGGLAVPGVELRNGRRFFDVDWNVITPGYFATMKMALLTGRDFSDADREGTPSVVIVNETAARQWWPRQDALGKTLLQETGRPDAPDAVRTLTVVGVARDSKYRNLGEDPRPFVYVPIQQQYMSRTVIAARSAHGQRLAGELRALLASMNPNLPIVQSLTFDAYSQLGLLPQRIAASVAGSLGLVGVLLAAIGIYGVTAYMVSSRTREIGIRMALGAERASVVRMVLRQGLTLTMIGAAIGLAVAAAASRLLGSLLFGVGATDPLTFIGSTLLFFVVGAAACYVPARRATAIGAMDALRYD